MQDGDIEGDEVEIITVADDGGRGVFVSCGVDLRPGDLVAGLCDLIAKVTQAALDHPRATRAGELELGDDDMESDDDDTVS
ncbi:MAG: hypothetical protein H0T92_01750 [Pyrinomonadaceae bacterium]|nr:hypothetical protein [Pyrinomonadaceae bacterium]